MVTLEGIFTVVKLNTPESGTVMVWLVVGAKAPSAPVEPLLKLLCPRAVAASITTAAIINPANCFWWLMLPISPSLQNFYLLLNRHYVRSNALDLRKTIRRRDIHHIRSSCCTGGNNCGKGQRSSIAGN